MLHKKFHSINPQRFSSRTGRGRPEGNPADPGSLGKKRLLNGSSTGGSSSNNSSSNSSSSRSSSSIVAVSVVAVAVVVAIAVVVVV